MNNLDQVFNVVPFDEKEYVTVLQPKEEGKVVTANQAAADPTIDFGLARDSLTTIVEIGLKSVEKASEFAKASQDPESFESVASIMKATTQAAMALMGIHKDLGSIGKNQTPQ